MDEGLLVEVGATVSNQPGRRRIDLELNRSARYAVGIQLGDTYAMVVLVNLAGQVCRTETVEKDAGAGLVELLTDVIAAVQRLCQAAGIQTSNLLGCGVGVAGLVNPAAGLVYLAPNLHGSYVRAVETVQAQLNCPVYVDNEVNTMALGELWFGAGQGRRRLLCVSVGQGIGGGIVINGAIYRGETGIAGEIGHTIIDVNGPRCGCGNHGCLETMGGGHALITAVSAIRDVGDLTARGGLVRSLERIEGYLKEGDPEVTAAAARMARYLAVGLANAIHSYNPELLIVGGPVAVSCPSVIQKSLTMVGSLLLEGAKSTVLTASALAGQAESLGAAALVLQRFFEPNGPE